MEKYNTLTQDNVTAYLKTIDNTNTYNNAGKALVHLSRMMRVPIHLKFKRSNRENLIIAPSLDKVRAVISGVPDPLVKAYLGLCATTGVRVGRLLALRWDDIDFDNGFVLRKVENIRTKHYRPNPLHRDIRKLLDALPRENDRVFPLSDGKRIKEAIERTHTRLTPTQLRDFFYNQALGCGMNSVIVEWLMGHDIGIAKHYLADNIRQEYSKFEDAIRFP